MEWSTINANVQNKLIKRKHYSEDLHGTETDYCAGPLVADQL